MKPLLIILSFALFSCSGLTDEKHFYIDPTLKPFYDSFIREGSKRGFSYNGDLTLVIGKLNHVGGAGEDGQTDYGRTMITIDKGFVDSYIGNSFNVHIDTLHVEYVVFHELGHLLLHRSHTEEYSIMTPDEQYLVDYITDPKKRDILIDELFKANN